MMAKEQAKGPQQGDCRNHGQGKPPKGNISDGAEFQLFHSFPAESENNHPGLLGTSRKEMVARMDVNDSKGDSEDDSEDDDNQGMMTRNRV